jgi:Heparinase II/III-like protein
MRSLCRRLLAAIALALCLVAVSQAETTHPRLYVTDADRDAVRAKIETYPWARHAYATLKGEVDRYVALTQSDPTWMTSRLLMNWQTHYEIPRVRRERWIGGDGHAPIPTPRFAGARDWVTHDHTPERLEDFRPYNDNNGLIWLIDDRTGAGGWTDPGQTGRTIEVANARILQLAANASFVYWLTRDEKYAHFAADILWTYMDGFSYVQLPHDLSNPHNGIIGMTSFEVIHEDSMLPLGECYDFLHDDLAAHGRDVGLIAAQLKRLADRVIDGGNAVGNWNLNQAKEIAPATLALDDNSAYADGRGRQYYVDALLNARLPAQTGILHVLREGYDPITGIWPEAPGYGFGTTPQIAQIASYMSGDTIGRGVLNDPMLAKAITGQLQLLYPNGWSVGLGDTDNTRVSAVALELLIAAARKRGDEALETRLTPVLQREIDDGFYNRAAQANIGAIAQYVGALKSFPSADAADGRTFFAPPLNILIQRDGEFAAAMYGSEGGHVHANGLNLELYGAGMILGADPGRGSSYWQPDHRDYYSQPPAHNTVIVNALSTYPAQGPGHIEMKIESMEPSSGAPANSPDISYAQCSFEYFHPPSVQQRTVALVRIGDDAGFYFDVFRSRQSRDRAGFHDYLYHNIGQRLDLLDSDNHPLPLASSLFLATHGDLPGYRYFQNERSLVYSGDFRAQFTARTPDGADHIMSAWMLGNLGRRIFAVNAPPDHAGRESLPKELNSIPMPTLLVRQNGDAWNTPFICIYEPHLGASTGRTRAIRAAHVETGAAVAACVVDGDSFNAILAQDDQPTAARRIEGWQFQGNFAAILRHGGQIDELYLGHGRLLGNGDISIQTSSDSALDASLRRTPGGWAYSSSAPIEIRVNSRTYVLAAGHNVPLPAASNH